MDWRSNAICELLGVFVICHLGTVAGTPAGEPNGDTPVVAFEEGAGQLLIRLGGEPLATYVYNDPKIARPFLAHVKAPGGVQVTRAHPPVPGRDATDHAAMHPGIWLAFGDISGADFWRNRGKVVHERFVEPPTGGKGSGSFAVVQRYVSENEVICRERFRLEVSVQPSGTLLVLDSVFKSDHGDIEFGDQEEMGLGVRLATPLTVKMGGRILNSEGRTNEKGVWGRVAEWCDYSGSFEGRSVGVTLLPDPGNARRCWFHARDYGLLVANPFGKRAGNSARTKVEKGETLRLRFGVLLHSSPAGQRSHPKKAYREFLKQIGARTSAR